MFVAGQEETRLRKHVVEEVIIGLDATDDFAAGINMRIDLSAKLLADATQLLGQAVLGHGANDHQVDIALRRFRAGSDGPKDKGEFNLGIRKRRRKDVMQPDGLQHDITEIGVERMGGIGGIVGAIAVLFRNDQPHALECIQLGFHRLLGERHLGNNFGPIPSPPVQAEEHAQQLSPNGRANQIGEKVHFEIER